MSGWPKTSEDSAIAIVTVDQSGTSHIKGDNIPSNRTVIVRALRQQISWLESHMEFEAETSLTGK